jgi:thiol:disulfide interchange protein DsbD
MMLWITVLALSFFLLTPSLAQDLNQNDEDQQEYVTFRVLAERTTVAGGEEIWVGVEQSIAPEWHTYWRNPGDSGAAPQHHWNLPEGFSVGEILWPAPKKMPYPPLMNFGYENNVFLMQKLSLPDTLPEGVIRLGLTAEALVCKDICIPAFADLELVLNDPENTEELNAAYFEKAQTSLPEPASWVALAASNQDEFTLKIELPISFQANVHADTLAFFPSEWGLIDNAAPQNIRYDEDGAQLIITQKSGERSAQAVGAFEGVLTFADAANEKRAVSLEVTPKQTATTPQITGEALKVAGTGFFMAVIFAILGGLILNLMPCVFPVLSLKALSLVKIAEKDSSAAKMHGLSYTGGIIVSFLVIAGILIALQAGGSQIGWGFQLQSPIVIALLAYLLFVIGLNLAGYFDITSNLGNLGGSLTQGNGYTSSFFTGVLATLVATPCTAPFMGVALGYALLQPPIISLSVFAALGFGLALPYLALAFFPALQKSMPKPGAWMDVFKQTLSFPMFAFAAWLVWILAQQSGAFSVLAVLLGMILIAFALWLGKHLPAKGLWRGVLKVVLVLSAILPLLLVSMTYSPAAQLALGSSVSAGDAEGGAIEGKTFGEKFSPTALAAALESDHPVFVEMTAAWCITCKVNHATSINIESTKQLFAEQNVKFLIGDWTNQDSDITSYLKQFGRNGVPIYVFYGAPDGQSGQRPEPVVLPQILTPGIVANTIKG